MPHPIRYRTLEKNIESWFPKKIGKTPLILASVIGFYMFGWGFVSPVLGIYLDLITQNNTSTGLLFSILPLIGIIFSIPVGRLTDFVNKTKLFITGCASYLFVVLGYLMSWLYPEAIVLTRILHGFLMLVVWISFDSLLRSITKKVSSVFSICIFSQKIGYILGAILLSFLFYFGILEVDNIYLSFFILFGVLALIVIVSPILFGFSNVFKFGTAGEIFETLKNKKITLKEFKEIKNLKRNAHAMFILNFGIIMFTTSISLFFPIMIFKTGFPIWMIILIALVPESLFGNFKSLVFLIGIMAIGGILLSQSDGMLSFIVFYSVCIGSHILLGPIINSIVSMKIKKEFYGEVTGGLSAFGKAGGFVGALGTGYLADVYSYGVSFIIMSVGLIIISGFSLWLLKSKG